MPGETITTKFEVDVTQFKKGLSDANRYIRMANSEFDKATAGVGKWSDSADGLRAKLTQLNRVLDGQEAAAAVLRHEYNRVVAEQGETSKGAQELAIKLNKQEAAAKKTAAQIDHYQAALDDMEAAADAAGDESKNLGKGLDDVADAAKDADKATDGVGKGLAGALGKAATAAGNLARNMAGIAGKAVVNSIKGLAAASGALVTAFLATAETSKEWTAQMNKLDAVAKNSGRSTQAVKNQFMEFYGILGDETAATTTASNLEAIGLSQKNLASVTNSMAGIWAQYGDSIPLDGLAESINESSRCAVVTGNLADALNWAGVNEDQFNEKLAACTSEQQRQQLIVDTLNGLYGELGETYKKTNADIIESNKANAKMQDVLAQIGRAAMPVVSTMKLMGAAALEDLLPGIEKLGGAFRGLLDGSKTAASEMGAAVGGLLQQIGQKVISALPSIATMGVSVITSLVQGIISAAPSLAAGVGQIVQHFIQAAPQLLSAGAAMIAQLLQGLASAMPSIIQQAGTLVGGIVSALRDNLPLILAAGGEVVYQLLSGITSNLPAIAQGAISAIGGFVQGLQTNLPIILQKGRELLGKLGEGIRTGLPGLVSQALDIIMNFATTLYDNAPTLIDTGFDLLSNLVQGILSSLPSLISKAPEIISKFANTLNDNMPKILKRGIELVIQIIKGILSAIPTLISNVPKIITAIVDVWEAFNWLQLGKKAITWLKDGVLKMVGAVKGAGKNILESIVNIIKQLPGNLKNLGTQAITWMKNGITSMRGSISSAGSNILAAVVNIIKSLPGKLLEFGKSAVSKMGGALSSGVSTVKSAAGKIFDGIVSYFQKLPSKLLSVGKDLVKGLWNGISDMTGWVIGKIKGFGESVLGGIKKFFGIKSPSRVFRDEVGKMLPAGLAEGVARNTKAAVKAAASMARQTLGAANSELSGGLRVPGVSGAAGGIGAGGAGGTTYVFNQYNTSPKALSRADIYRQTKNQLRFATQAT